MTNLTHNKHIFNAMTPIHEARKASIDPDVIAKLLRISDYLFTQIIPWAGTAEASEFEMLTR